MSQKRSVIIVEDEFILYQELQEFFEDKGFHVIGFNDGKPVDNYEDAILLLKKEEPDIAVLDIQIKGKKDGIELGAFIHKHYDIPVIYLSAFDNFENIDRVRQIGSNGFVVKNEKPVDKNQLWASVQLALPRLDIVNKKKTMGSFFKVKEMAISGNAHLKRIIPQNEGSTIEIETYLKWGELLFVESYNSKVAGGGNNNLLMHTTDSKRAFMLRGTLSELENRLPAQFVRFDKSTIINLNQITGRNKTGTVYFIGELSFKLNDTYKAAAIEKIDLLLGRSENIPE